MSIMLPPPGVSARKHAAAGDGQTQLLCVNGTAKARHNAPADHVAEHGGLEAGRVSIDQEKKRVIGERAFSEIETLTSVTICRGVRAIGYGAFYQCRSLKQADIPGSVVFIDEGAFADCPDLTITCREYTEAWEYCKRENVAFVLPD